MLGRPIYRNLDEPLQVLGLSPAQFVITALVVVIGGELLTLVGVSRYFSFAAGILLYVLFYSLNRRFGRQFLKQVMRFLTLPDRLYVRHLRAQTNKKRDFG